MSVYNKLCWGVRFDGGMESTEPRRGAAVATEVGRDAAVAARGDVDPLVSPRVPELREVVREQHCQRGGVNGAGLRHVISSCRCLTITAAMVRVGVVLRAAAFGPCLLPRKFYKIFHILRHIESLDACMEY